MAGSCNLEVEVNGQETFMVNMKTIASYSGRFRKLFGRTETRKMKVILHGFPGGAEGFELFTRFCYNNGRIHITPHNILLLNAVAQYMEMDEVLEGISCWSWSELLEALKQCPELILPQASRTVDNIVDSLVQRLSSYSIATSSTSSSSESSCFRLSTDSRKTDSLSYGSTSIWWFEDLVFLSVNWIEVIVKKMLSMKFDHSVLCRFLVYYQKSRFLGVEVTEKRKILESMISLFSQLDPSSVSCKCLFQLFHLCSVLKMSDESMTTVESLIGSKLDQAIVDQLLVPSPAKHKYAYDVNLVLRILKAFLSDRLSSLDRLRKVGFLMDSYLKEVGPDFNLNPSKFEELVTVLPSAARHCHDQLYESIDLYFETHRKLCEDDRLRICSVVNYGKLSADVVKHLARNSRFPSSFRAAAMDKCKKDERVRTYERKLEKKVVEMEKAYKSRMQKTRMGSNLTITWPRLSSPRHDRYFPMLCSI